jgi:hypothetical protein
MTLDEVEKALGVPVRPVNLDELGVFLKTAK